MRSDNGELACRVEVIVIVNVIVGSEARRALLPCHPKNKLLSPEMGVSRACESYRNVVYHMEFGSYKTY